MQAKERWDEDVRKVSEGLKRKIRAAGLTYGDVEQRAGMGRDYLRQVLRGTLKLRMEHISAILEVLNVPIVEFFVEVYGPPPSTQYPEHPEHHTYATTVRVMNRTLLRRMIWKLREKGVFSDDEARQMLVELEREIPLAERDVY
jgi:transcriptional regulator with XRE-family HTH domain